MRSWKAGLLVVALCFFVLASKPANAQTGPYTSAHPNTADDNWQHDMLWSWNDTGSCESAVQKDIQALDAKYNSHMYTDCIKPLTVGASGPLSGVRPTMSLPTNGTGRRCLMQKYACDAAKNGFDTRAWEITMATQDHVDWRRGRLQEAGQVGVAGFLRTYFHCKK